MKDMKLTHLIHLTISCIVHMLCEGKEMISEVDKMVFDNSKFKETEQRHQQKLLLQL